MNGEDLGAAVASGVPKRVVPVLEVTGSTRGVTVTRDDIQCCREIHVKDVKFHNSSLCHT